MTNPYSTYSTVITQQLLYVIISKDCIANDFVTCKYRSIINKTRIMYETLELPNTDYVYRSICIVLAGNTISGVVDWLKFVADPSKRLYSH